MQLDKVLALLSVTPGGGGDAAACYFQRYPNPENFQGQFQQGSEQSDQVEDDQ